MATARLDPPESHQNVRHRHPCRLRRRSKPTTAHSARPPSQRSTVTRARTTAFELEAAPLPEAVRLYYKAGLRRPPNPPLRRNPAGRLTVAFGSPSGAIRRSARCAASKPWQRTGQHLPIHGGETNVGHARPCRASRSTNGWLSVEGIRGEIDAQSSAPSTVDLRGRENGAAVEVESCARPANRRTRSSPSPCGTHAEICATVFNRFRGGNGRKPQDEQRCTNPLVDCPPVAFLWPAGALSASHRYPGCLPAQPGSGRTRVSGVPSRSRHFCGRSQPPRGDRGRPGCRPYRPGKPGSSGASRQQGFNSGSHGTRRPKASDPRRRAEGAG